jgi:hypothetical protein
MRPGWKFRGILFALLVSAAALPPKGASAITAEVAKKCNVLLEKQFPPRQAGNPAAGSSKGSAQDQRAFFQKCVDNGGNMDSAPPPAQTATPPAKDATPPAQDTK